MTTLRRYAPLLSLLLVVAACTSDKPRAAPSPSPSAPPSPSAAETCAPAKAKGPLDGLRWPADKLQPGMLLHDDGTRLLSVSLDGSSKVLWTHPKVDTFQIAAIPGGELAMTLGTSSTTFLYLLTPDGRVTQEDAVSGWSSWMEDPILLRSSGESAVTYDWYWIENLGPREQEEHCAKGDAYRLMTLVDGQPVPVDVPVERAGHTFDVFAYPGGRTATLRAEGPGRPTFRVHEGSPDGGWTHVSSTGSDLGIVWLTPTTYVVGDNRGGKVTLRLFTVGGDSRTIYAGKDVSAYTDGWDPMIALDASHLLVLDTASASKGIHAMGGEPSRDPGLALQVLDVCTGERKPTGVIWHMDDAWSAVMPQRGPSDPCA